MTTIQLIDQELNSLKFTYNHVCKIDSSRCNKESMIALEQIKKQMILLEKDKEILLMVHNGKIVNG